VHGNYYGTSRRSSRRPWRKVAMSCWTSTSRGPPDPQAFFAERHDLHHAPFFGNLEARLRSRARPAGGRHAAASQRARGDGAERDVPPCDRQRRPAHGGPGTGCDHRVVPNVKTETLYGVHAVQEALAAGRRDLFEIYVDRSHAPPAACRPFWPLPRPGEIEIRQTDAAQMASLRAHPRTRGWPPASPSTAGTIFRACSLPRGAGGGPFSGPGPDRGSPQSGRRSADGAVRRRRGRAGSQGPVGPATPAVSRISAGPLSTSGSPGDEPGACAGGDEGGRTLVAGLDRSAGERSTARTSPCPWSW